MLFIGDCNQESGKSISQLYYKIDHVLMHVHWMESRQITPPKMTCLWILSGFLSVLWSASESRLMRCQR